MGWAAWRVRRGQLLTIAIFAVLFRLVLLFVGSGGETFLLYDNDLWRYLWDGHLTAEGVSPYSVAPSGVEADDALSELLLDDDRWWELYDRVYYPDFLTVYPPFSQGAFRLANAITPGQPLGWNAVQAAHASIFVGVAAWVVAALWYEREIE